MAKHMKPHEEMEEDFEGFDFLDDDMHEHCDDGMADMMNCLFAASKDQTIAALDLTTLVIDASGSDSMKEEQVFAIFKRASKAVAENSPLKDLLQQFGG